MFGLNAKNIFQQIASDVRSHRRDLIVVSFLLASCAIIFAKFRAVPIQSETLGMVVFAALAVVALLWCFRFPGPVLEKSQQPLRKSDLLVIVFLTVVTAAIYYPLSLIHFDTGTDLSVAFGVDAIWFEPWAGINRPLVGIGPLIAMKITPTTLGGFFFVNSFCRFATGALLYLAIVLYFPKGRHIGIIVGVLFILNPAELARFNLWSIYYQVALFSFIVSSFLFLYAYHQGSRFLLLLACSFLGVSFPAV